jgi:hypothetical protein
MKKEILFSLIFLLNLHYSIAQSWEWSKKIPAEATDYHRGVFTDALGNIYCYGSNVLKYSSDFDPGVDSVGSYLNCFDADGNLKWSKRWKIPFYIRHMETDGATSLFFAAYFYGTQTIDGITISSEGYSDGLLGRMDINGTVTWMHSFGGPGADQCLGLTFNKNDNTLYACGNILDTLRIDHVSLGAGQQSSILLKYSPAGILLAHKCYDFVASRNLPNNSGLEMTSNSGGDLYVLMERDGQHSLGDDITGPYMGTYVMKLNIALDTLWSRYIIGPGCYYGYSTHSLRAAENGDAYVTRTCDGKYGCSTDLLRLDSGNGTILWNYPNTDGRYFDLAINGNTVYVIGNEGANGCPCPDFTFGYNIIKIFDENNVLTGETRAYADFTSITADNGGIYVYGNLGQECVLGPDVLHGDSIPTYSYYQYYGAHLSKLSATPNLATAVAGTAAAYEADIYPNPTGSSLTIHYKTEKNGALNMRLYDVNGRVVYAEAAEHFSGEYNRKVDLQQQPKGIYFLDVNLGEERMTKKIVLQ